MKFILVAAFITLLVLGTGCGRISPANETSSDGIQVHGHWTVTVTNPDGTEGAVHEFDNAFQNQGLLTRLLLGHNRIDNSYIKLITTIDNNNNLNCLEQSGVADTVVLLEAQPTIEELEGLPFTLSATCTVATTPPEQEQHIHKVQTTFEDSDNCLQTFYEAFGKIACVTYTYEGESGELKLWEVPLTLHEFSPWLSVSNGQQIGFNVRITFE